MRKFMIGILVGVSLTFATSIFAEDITNEVQSLIGKKVEGSFPLTIDGHRASKDVIVIEGTSYVPVRAASELFGYDIFFDADLGVKLSKLRKADDTNMTSGETNGQTINPSSEEDLNKIVAESERILRINQQIENNKQKIEWTKLYIGNREEELKKFMDPELQNKIVYGEQEYNRVVEDKKQFIQKLQQEISDLELQNVELEKQLVAPTK